MTAEAQLPIDSTDSPSSEKEVEQVVAACRQAAKPVYTFGGATGLASGIRSSQTGLGLNTSNLNQVIDFPARDLTITVEAGVTMASLTQTLTAEGLELPL